MIVSVVQDILLRLNLSISYCRSQCYDGASAMSEAKRGVASRLEQHAFYTHCYGHALNLACQNALKGIKVMEDTLNTVHEIKISQTRKHFHEIQR